MYKEIGEPVTNRTNRTNRTDRLLGLLALSFATCLSVAHVSKDLEGTAWKGLTRAGYWYSRTLDMQASQAMK